jgi:hypothetical protein
MRKGINIIISIGFTLLTLSCEKADTDIMSIEGIVKDYITGQPVSGVTISIDALKSPSGMGIITDGRRKNVGQTSTDSRGYYRVKLKVFDEAERLEFSLNSGMGKDGYVSTEHILYFQGTNKPSSRKLDLTLSATALVRIKFKNAQPFSDSDFFYFGWSDRANGITRGVLKKDNCGTVLPSEAITWTGQDVCGVYIVEVAADGTTLVHWTARKAGVTREFKDSVYIKRGELNEFSLNY